ncbi:MAG: NfeD family protein, partial [Verrucomicrobiota bacterium]
APLLMTGGLIGLYMEIKTPGFGIFGIGSLVCFALYYWAHHVAGLAGASEVLILIVGFAFLLAEVFLLPGFGVAGTIGVLCVLWALLGAMVEAYPGGPPIPEWRTFEIPVLKLATALAGTVALGGLVTRFLPESRLGSKLILQTAMNSDEGYQSSQERGETMVGRIGRTLTQLRPSGAALFDDDRLDVVTQGQFIEQDVAVEILEVHGNRIIVESTEVTKEDDSA